MNKNLGSSLWQFGQASNDLKDFHLNDVSLLKLKPIHKETAKRQLQNFMVMGLLAKQMPLVLPLMTSLNIVALNTKMSLNLVKASLMIGCQVSMKIITKVNLGKDIGWPAATA